VQWAQLLGLFLLPSQSSRLSQIVRRIHVEEGSACRIDSLPRRFAKLLDVHCPEIANHALLASAQRRPNRYQDPFAAVDSVHRLQKAGSARDHDVGITFALRLQEPLEQEP
jgi:hypothetical protein